MKQKDVLKKIGVIIRELSDQFEYLETVPGDLNDLELELFVANANFLTDHIEILCKLNLQNRIANRPVDKQEASYEQKYFEPMVQQMKHAVGLTDAKPFVLSAKTEMPEKANFETPTIPEAVKQVAPIAPEPVFEYTPPFLLDPATVNAAPIVAEPAITYTPLSADQPATLNNIPTEPEPIVLPEAPSLNENLFQVITDVTGANIVSVNETNENESSQLQLETQIADEVITSEVIIPEVVATVPTPVIEVMRTEEPVQEIVIVKELEVLSINQKISTQLADKVPSKSDQISIKPINDIKLAITLNDKLLYVKDLFNGYNLAYAEAIEILNRFTTFEEASRFLKTNYVTKNNWESKPATTEKFYALLRRRYA